MNLSETLPHQLQAALNGRWPLLVPAGCIEYHGPHLPLGVDTIIVQELVDRVARHVDCLVAPPFWYGPTGYAVTGPEQGTVDVSTERFGRHVKDVLGSFWEIGFPWIVICIHHQQLNGPQALAIRQAAVEVTFEYTHAERGHGWWGKAPLPPSDNVFERIQVWPSVLPSAAQQGVEMADHAGYYETALLMAARPHLVDLDRLGMNVPWYCTTSISKARSASVEAGERLWQFMVEAWVENLVALQPRKRPTPQEVTIQGLF
jgi:creatinine amidohydrolase/Fe(II)-dependent formamide hydrolase-like protein